MSETKGDPEKLTQITADVHRAVTEVMCSEMKDPGIGLIILSLQRAGTDAQGALTHIALSSNISHRAKAVLFAEMAAKSLAIAELGEAEEMATRAISEVIGTPQKPH